MRARAGAWSGAKSWARQAGERGRRGAAKLGGEVMLGGARLGGGADRLSRYARLATVVRDRSGLGRPGPGWVGNNLCPDATRPSASPPPRRGCPAENPDRRSNRSGAGAYHGVPPVVRIRSRVRPARRDGPARSVGAIVADPCRGGQLSRGSREGPAWASRGPGARGPRGRDGSPLVIFRYGSSGPREGAGSGQPLGGLGTSAAVCRARFSVGPPQEIGGPPAADATAAHPGRPEGPEGHR